MLLTVISAARGAAIQVLFECATESALLSVFGEYNRELLDKYDVFFIDLSYLSNSPDPKNLEVRLNGYFDDNFHPDKEASFLFYSDIADVTGTNVSLTGYELASDGLGKPFADQVVKYMSNLYGADFIEEMTDMISVYDSYDLSSERYEELKDYSIKGISSTSGEEETWEQTVLKKNILSLLDLADAEKKSKIPIGLSLESIPPAQTLLLREKEKGTENTGNVFFSPAENILFDEYVMTKMGNYVNKKEESKLRYETEYIIVGSFLDIDNFSKVYEVLMVTRTLADYISLNMASDKVEKVREIAEPIASFLHLPEEVVTQFFLMIWAEFEASFDCIALCLGKEIPLIKKSEEIYASFEGILGYIELILSELKIPSGSDDSEDSGISPNPDSETQSGIPEIKLDYEDYMRIFLFFVPPQLKVYRTMDMIEADMRKAGTENEYFRFDACADRIKAVFSIETGYDFRFTSEKKYSYFE
ncbi:MAG: DUF5702 domain-containing protein [Lachnospiraceae bacterium]|nr:DUF5702 domain-containing protein [Lachnospiraceae bacterium]